jgi:hypothetical protein
MTIIEIRPHPWGWKVFEGSGNRVQKRSQLFIGMYNETLPGSTRQPVTMMTLPKLRKSLDVFRQLRGKKTGE